jgi:hypothetical protein
MIESRRIRREKKTIGVMIGMYCRARHGNAIVPCEECSGLLSYAHQKIDTCVFHDHKPVCNECRIHCYSRGMREEVRNVMRFSGPRMLLAHPLLGILHMVDRIHRPGGKRSPASPR